MPVELHCLECLKKDKGDDPEHVIGGHCLFKWEVVTLSKEKGGLGIKDIEIFSRALQLCWLWHKMEK